MIRASYYVSWLLDSFLSMDLAKQSLEQNREKVRAFLLGGMEELSNRLLKEDTPEAVRQEIREKLELDFKNRLDHYVETIVNHTAVLLCADLEIIIDQLLGIIFQERKETLIGFGDQQSIDLKFIIEARDYDHIQEAVRDKVISSFSRESIGKKIGLLGRKLGIDQQELFNWSWLDDEMQEKLRNSNLDKLVEIFETRNHIVHRGLRPYKQMQEVHFHVDFFQYFLLNLCRALSNKYNIPHDFPIPI